MKAMYCTQTYETNGRPVTNPVLINSMRAGLNQAWGQLYTVYWNWLVRLAVGMGVSRQDAEDLAQRTFIALAKNISTFIYEPARAIHCI
jgi:DNA-directed RNA polymerase specialized sigma24 family protein